MRRTYFCLITLLATSAFGQAVPPAPTLTAGPDFKGLQFDWEPVAGASRYELEYRAHRTGPFVRLGNVLPASATSFRYRFPLHLFDWTFARYRLAACNSTGCSRSAEVSVSSLRRAAVGVITPTDPAVRHVLFADEIGISPDGMSLVAAEHGNFSSTGGLTEPPGAIYVFRRASNGEWLQRARLQSTIPAFIEGRNQMNVGISADGNTVVLGMPNYFHEEFDEQSGEAFVFRFNGTSWVRTRLFSGTRGAFGQWVAINDAGDLVAVATGFPTPQIILYRLTSGMWQPVRAIANRPGANEGCSTGVAALSRDGSTVAQLCAEHDSNNEILRHYVRLQSGANWTTSTELPMVMSTPSPITGYAMSDVAIDGNADMVAAQIHIPDTSATVSGPSEVHVFRRSAGVYSKMAELTSGPWRAATNRRFFGLGLALSPDGRTLVIGDSWDNGTGLGPRAAPLNSGDAITGGAYVFRLGTTWRLANMIKPNSVDDTRTFGRKLSLSRNGQTLIIGYTFTGTSQISGAVFMY